MGQSLEPPAGAIAPTMKPLSAVEPRTAVGPTTTPGDAEAVFVITRPGSYYLTGPVNGEPGKSGIEIAASNVTLDLSGFDVVGVEKAVSGVRVRDEQRDVRVHNGTARAWPIAGVDMTFASSSVVEDVRCTAGGVGILASQSGVVRRCFAMHNISGGGILAGSSATIEDCVASFNVGVGVYVLDASRLLRCTIEQNTTDGVYLDGSGCLVGGCVVVRNGRHGIASIYGGAVTDSTAEYNAGDGMWSIGPMQFERCRAASNAGDGIEAADGSSVTRCSVRENAQDGVRAGARCVVSECHAVGHGAGAGVRVVGEATRVEGCTLSGNAIGVKVEATGCLVVRNAAGASAKAPFDIAPGNAFGPVVPVAGAGDLSALPAAAHPLANLVY